jgi:hypothetical protein
MYKKVTAQTSSYAGQLDIIFKGLSVIINRRAQFKKSLLNPHIAEINKAARTYLRSKGQNKEAIKKINLQLGIIVRLEQEYNLEHRETEFYNILTTLHEVLKKGLKNYRVYSKKLSKIGILDMRADHITRENFRKN